MKKPSNTKPKMEVVHDGKTYSVVFKEGRSLSEPIEFDRPVKPGETITIRPDGYAPGLWRRCS